MTVRLDEMTSPELDARVKAGPPVVILPTGAFEQHGPHLPLGTDAMIPQRLAERVAAQIDALVAPTLSYGYKSQPKSGGGNHMPGCASLDGATYTLMVRDLICDFARHGLTKIVLFDGHMENQMFLTEAADLSLRALKSEGITDVRIVKMGYWISINAALEKVLFPDGLISWELEHAAVMETSVMLHLAPDLVRRDLIPDHPPADFPLYDVYPFDPASVSHSGALSSAAGATAEKGKAVVETLVPELARQITEAFQNMTV
ncbi:creatininase [Actibacterium sp. 188UL27-1]|uniref:creatininase n=1 Tax=Actibacterium sp. 188UL27-1 TaxID=2786961 RepID=UPI00195F01E2|nr:creatininase [Actibacterium sp. 188UL27-1]MBM7067206.1 creatininase [Actibacterium sp. 188UL27-1]